MQSTTEKPVNALGTLPTLRGSVIRPDDAAYDGARAVFYGGIDKRPAAIVRVADVGDVQRVVAMAREGHHELALRSGGHSIAGHGTTNGGVVLDLRDMAKVEIDATARTAWVETGATAPAALSAPEELTTIGNIMPAPPLPFLPADVHGRLVIFGMIAYAGDPDSAGRAIAPFRALATPIADTVAAMPYAGMYPPEDPNVHPSAIGRTMFVDSIDGHAAKTIFEYLSSSDAAMRVAQLRPLGGAAARVPADATAYAHRSKPMLVNVAAFYEGPEDRRVRAVWVDEFAKAVQPDDTGAYVGFLSDEGESRKRAAYPGATWNRLTRIKAEYDPTNLFRLNQNIPPAHSRVT